MKYINISFSRYLNQLGESEEIFYLPNGIFFSYCGEKFLEKKYPQLYNNYLIFLDNIEKDLTLIGKNKGSWHSNSISSTGEIIELSIKPIEDQLRFFKENNISHYHLGNKDGSYNNKVKEYKEDKIYNFNLNGKEGSSVVHYKLINEKNTLSVIVLALSLYHTKPFPAPYDENGYTIFWHEFLKDKK